MEIWKDVKGFEGWYSVSSLGKIRRDKVARGAAVGRILKPKKHSQGYRFVTLSRDNVKYQCLIHALVCEAFHSKTDLKAQVNHRDGDRTHNVADNLEWMTSQENNLHALYVLSHASRLSLSEVQQIRELYATREYSQKTIGEQFGVSQKQVSNIVSGESWGRLPGGVVPFFPAVESVQSGPEQWKKSKRFPDYSVSNYGRLRRDKAGKGAQAREILKPTDDGHGYNKTTLRRDGKYYSVKIYWLVVQEFVHPFKGEVIHHKNRNKKDDRANNLEWTTHLRNVQHAFGHR